MLSAELSKSRRGAIISPWIPLTGLFLLITWVIYAPAVSGGWSLDDYSAIVLNDRIKNLGLAWKSLPSLRGVALFSFSLDYELWGLDPSLSRVVNIGIHLCNSLLVVALCRALLRDKSWGLAIAVGVIFLCHPVQTSAVSYIVQRMTLLSTLFALCSLLLIIGYFEAVEKGAKKASLSLLGGALLAGLLSVFAKENTILLPCLVPFVAWVIGRGRLQKGWQLALVTLGVVPLAVLLARFLAVNETAVLLDSSAIFFRDVGPQLYSVVDNYDWLSLRYLLSQGEAFWVYLKLLLWPMHQALDYCWPIPDLEFRWLPVLALVTISGLWVALYRTRARYPLSFFGLHWIFIFAAIESSIIPLDPIFEHRLYLVMLGVVLIVAEQVKVRSKNRTVLFCVILFVVGVYGALGWQRNQVWGGDEGAFWQADMAVSERAPRPLSWRGVVHFKEKEFALAANLFSQLIEKGSPLAYLRATGEALYFAGQETEAFEIFSRLDKQFPGENSLLVFSAYSAARRGQWVLMEESLEKSLARDQNDMRVPLLRATLAAEQGDELNAAIFSQQVINLWESMVSIEDKSLNAVGYVSWARRLRGNAIERLSGWLAEQNRLVTERPEDINAMADFAGQLLLIGEFEKAKAYYLRASVLAPGAWALYYNLGIISNKQKDFASAAKFYKRASEFSVNNLLILENLAAVALKQKQYEKAESIYGEITQAWPSNGKAWLALGGLQELTRRYTEAKESYEFAAGLPNFTFAANQSLAGLRAKGRDSLSGERHAPGTGAR